MWMQLKIPKMHISPKRELELELELNNQYEALVLKPSQATYFRFNSEQLKSAHFKSSKHIKKVTGTLAIAAASLLGHNVHAEENQAKLDVSEPWKFDTALMYYTEPDRVSALEAIVNMRKSYDDESTVSLKGVFDTLTGASANGAVPQSEVQTFTRPSGNGQFNVDEGEVPLDDTFRDTRVELDLAYSAFLSSDKRYDIGAHASREFDYQSVGFNAGLSLDFNQKNTTLSVGSSFSFDRIKPYGGLPVALSTHVVQTPAMTDEQFQSAFNATRDGDTENKFVSDFLVGMTQVINKNTVMQLNISVSRSSGYHTDPFKIVSVINEDGLIQFNIYESRPQARSKHGIFWRTKIFNEGDIFDASYRLMSDNWGINSNTIDMRYKIPIGDSYIEPHVRFYQQSAADFYNVYLVDGALTPEFTTADYRLGELTTATIGAKYGYTTLTGNDMAFRLEYYQQISADAGFKAIGQLAETDYLPNVNALMFQVSYSF
jgi:hypothetical protein